MYSRLLCCLLLALAVRSQQVTQDPSSSIATTEDSIPTLSSVTDSIATTSITVPAVNITEQKVCETAKQVSGVCSPRQYCDYGTVAIDFTLYMPRGYERPCESGEVCCPKSYLLENTNPQGRSKPFDFDEEY